jgi:hypothetical protein
MSTPDRQALDLRGFLGIDPTRGEGLGEPSLQGAHQRQRHQGSSLPIHEAVMATSPNFYNLSRPVGLKPTLVVE